jgi:hypothetical protein
MKPYSSIEKGGSRVPHKKNSNLRHVHKHFKFDRRAQKAKSRALSRAHYLRMMKEHMIEEQDEQEKPHQTKDVSDEQVKEKDE